MTVKMQALGALAHAARHLPTMLLAAAGSMALASPITEPTQLPGATTLIDFNGIPSGNFAGPLVLAGVTFTGALNGINSSSYGAAASYPAYTSGMALGLPRAQGVNPVFTITFGTEVSQVGFGIFDTNFLGDVINAYDGAGNLLESTTPDALFPPGGSGADYVGFVRGSADIKRIEIIAGVSGGTLDALWIDNLRFSVPLPGTLSLALAGLLAAAGLSRRRS
jgi:hypothetical protein